MCMYLDTKYVNTIYIYTCMIYGSECWVVNKKDTQELPITEMRMLIWARGNTKKDHIKN